MMRIVFFFFLISPFLSKAAEDCDLVAAFSQTYFEEPHYKCGLCFKNIYRFIGTLPQLLRAKAQVIIIQQHSKGLKPLRPREEVHRWGYHVVLDVEGKIFDYDFGKSPRILEKRTYFETMFEKPPRGNPIHVRIIPAEDYMFLNKVVQNPVTGIPTKLEIRWFTDYSEPLYPSQMLDSYLKE